VIDPRLTQVGRDLVAKHIRPLSEEGGHVPLIGVAGAQGSGKTTLARALAVSVGGARLSLDDVYLTKADRQALARDLHPLLATRGPPLTHDLALLAATVAALRAAGPDTVTPLPAFDKRADDRAPPETWPVFTGRPSVILIDGWCLGALPQPDADLTEPVNMLERAQDPDRRWRRLVNDALKTGYAAAFAAFDAILFLAAPSFDVVLDWRCQQEAGLMGLASDLLPEIDRTRIAGFIQVFERITRSMLAAGIDADVIVTLDAHRTVTSVRAGSGSEVAGGPGDPDQS
jgi:D-glycerate 3-kinase